MKIIIDAMGGDNAPQAIVQGAVDAQKEFGVDIVLVGREAEVLDCLKQCNAQPGEHLRVVNADDIWYQDVARGYAGNDGYKGEGGLFPANINDGDSFTHEQTLNMPAKVLRWENTELVVLLLRRRNLLST